MYKKIAKRLVIVPLSIVIAFGAAGCATIFNGTHQNMLVASEPSGAAIFVNGMKVGETPETIKLSHRHSVTITISMPGYKTKTMKLTRSIDGWFWGNILLGGVIGMVVDASTGAMYTFSPSKINEKLKKDDLSIGITKKPAPGMKKIGSLTPD